MGNNMSPINTYSNNTWKSFEEFLTDKYSRFLSPMKELGHHPKSIYEYYDSMDNSIEAFSDALMEKNTLQTMKPAHPRILWKRLAEWNARLCRCGFLKQQFQDHSCNEYHCPNIFCNYCPPIYGVIKYYVIEHYMKVPDSMKWLVVVYMILYFNCADEERPLKFEPNPNLDSKYDIPYDEYYDDSSENIPCFCRFFLENIGYFLNDLVTTPDLTKAKQHLYVMQQLVAYIKIKFQYLRWPNQEQDFNKFNVLLFDRYELQKDKDKKYLYFKCK